MANHRINASDDENTGTFDFDDIIPFFDTQIQINPWEKLHTEH